jgi:hypothetical protein
MQKAGAALVALAAAVAVSGCGSGTSQRRVVGPPLLVPWHQIGDISLGEPRTRVEEEYGSPGHGFHVIQRYGDAIQGWYRGIHGSEVIVTFYGHTVGELFLHSPYYRTKSGLGVDSKIPLGRCHVRRIALNGCERRWHRFVYNAWARETLCNCWTKVGLGKNSLPATSENFLKPWFIIYMRHGRIAAFDFDLKYVD